MTSIPIRALALALALALPAAAQSRRPATIDDLMRIRSMSDVQLSPDGSRVLYVVSVPDVARNEHDTDVWMVPAAGGEPIRLTSSPKMDQSPRWSPDGRVVAFLSAREGAPNVYLIDLAGGEPRKLTSEPAGVQQFAWSPDGKRIGFVSADPPTEADKKAADDNAGVVVVDEKFSRARLRIIEIAGGKVVTLTGADRNVTALSWSPDGTRIAFAAQPTPRVADGEHSDLHLVPADSGAVTTLVALPGPDTGPVFSPDGRWIAFESVGGQPGLGAGALHLVAAAGGTPRRAAPGWDLGIQDPRWSADGRDILFVSTVGVRVQVMKLAVATGAVTPVSAGDRVHSAFSLSKDGSRMALAVQDPTSPPDVFLTPTSPFRPVRLTTLNPLVDSLALGRTEVIRWKSRDGLEIEGLLVKPVDYRAGTRYPVLTYVHGGPSGVFMLSFGPQLGAAPIPYQAEPYPIQVFAGKGYALFMPNPRGSSGYGTKFLRANVRDWGHGDFQDIMTGLDHLVATGIADPDRLGLMGWSYGGYMTSWAITQTDRFKAASVGAGLPNLISLHGATDVPDVLANDYFGGRPWKDKEVYERSSAIYHAGNIRTPTLIQHGEKDDRVQLNQGWELYRALEAAGVPRQFAIYPRQGHLILEPKLQRDMLDRNLAWFTRFVRERPVP